MKKTYKIAVDCANCANKMEEAVQKIDGVNKATVNFITQKFILDANDDVFDKVLDESIKTMKKVDSDFEIYN